SQDLLGQGHRHHDRLRGSYRSVFIILSQPLSSFPKASWGRKSPRCRRRAADESPRWDAGTFVPGSPFLALLMEIAEQFLHKAGIDRGYTGLLRYRGAP